MLVYPKMEIQAEAKATDAPERLQDREETTRKKRVRVRINFLWEECGCYPSQLESVRSHTRGMVNI